MMRKSLLVLIPIILVAALMMGLLIFRGAQPAGRSFEEAYSSARKLTFSVGEGSVITWEEEIRLSYGNTSSPVNSSIESVVIKNLTWPNFVICTKNGTSEGECGEVFFHMIAFPRELVGVTSINLPSLLYENMTVLMVNNGLTELKTAWGSSKAFNYTNSTSNYPMQNVSTITKLYVDPESGLVLRGDICLMRADISLTFTYSLTSKPEPRGGFQIDKPGEWEWGRPSPGA